MKSTLSKTLLLASLAVLSGEVLAACTVVIPLHSVSSSRPGPVILNTNVPDGQPLSELRSGGAYTLIRCNGDTPGVYERGYYATSGGAGAVGIFEGMSIYPTGITGVGVVMFATTPIADGFYDGGFVHGREGRFSAVRTLPALSNQFHFRFIKTSGTVPAGTHSIGSRRIGSVLLKNADGPGNLGSSEIYLAPLQVRTAAVPTCDLGAIPTLTLNPIRISNFTGTNAGLKYLDLTASCSNASSVTFKFTGTPDSANSTLFANTGSARGVALWLHTPNQTISHNATRTVAVSGNRAVLRVGAEYHKTSGALTQGSFVSNVTVNITYN